MSSTHMTFKALRLTCGLTQQAMASEMGVSISSVCRADDGDRMSGTFLNAAKSVARKHGITDYNPPCPCCGRAL